MLLRTHYIRPSYLLPILRVKSVTTAPQPLARRFAWYPLQFPGPKGQSPAPGLYRHYKSGDLYEVLGCVLHTETEETMVLYRALRCNQRNPLGMAFVRPSSMFMSSVEHANKEIKRFERIEDTNSK